MADRLCTQCGRTFAAPYLLRRHRERKTPCAPIVSTHELSPAEQQRPHVCRFCNHRFASRSGLSRHVKYTCQIAGSEAGMEKLYEHTLKQRLAEQELQMQKMQEQLDRLESAAAAPAVAFASGVNIMHADHVHNNMTINIFGSEDVSYLGRTEIRAILDKALRVSPSDPMKAAKHALTEIGYKVYSNPLHPENITCYVPNKRHEDVLIHTGERWELRPGAEITPEMYVRSMEIMFGQQPFENAERYGPLMIEAREREHDPTFAGAMHKGYRTLLVENKAKLRQADLAALEQQPGAARTEN